MERPDGRGRIGRRRRRAVLGAGLRRSGVRFRREGEAIARQRRPGSATHWSRGLLSIVAALGLLEVSVAAADFDGRVVAVHDGDTISVHDGRRVQRVRLAGIDAPERGQPYAMAARRALAAQVASRSVRVATRGRDGYGRVLGRVYVGDLDVNAEQVRSGHAWVFRRFGGEPLLVALEAEAKASRRGLWRDARPVPPWEWRDRSRPLPAPLPSERTTTRCDSSPDEVCA